MYCTNHKKNDGICSVAGIAIPIPIIGLRNSSLPNNITFSDSQVCVLKPDSFHDFIVFGSLAAFFIPLTIMMVIYLLTILVLRKKACRLRARVSHCLSRHTITQMELPKEPWSARAAGLHSPGSRQKPSYSGQDTRGEVPIRRMSTMGKKSMQNLSNEQRASKVLGIVFLLFVVMWCPFFITNVTSVLCHSCDKNVVGRLMEIFVWVGYVSSGINPLVYTLFNKTFRQAFSRYITCDYGSAHPPKVAHQCHGKISFHSSMAENSKLFMKNSINAATYQGPLRQPPAPIASPPSVLLDTLPLKEIGSKAEEQVSYL